MPQTSQGPIARFFSDLLFHQWTTKIAAFVLAVILFVFTRDEVTRTFEVQLRPVPDPERVLLTRLPKAVQVQVRGPWTRVNRLGAYDFGSATLRLEDMEPGPLLIDPAAIVMPPGVLLAGIQYDKVDLRFEEVVEPEISIVPAVLGQSAPDYRLVRVEATPNQWPVRGGRSEVQLIRQLTTEPLDVSEATRDVERDLPIVAPPGAVKLVGSGTPTVTVRAIIQPKPETREFTVPITAPEGIDPTGVIPRTYRVNVAGPLPDFRILEGLGVALPVEADVAAVQARTSDGGRVVEIRFGWVDAVPKSVRERLSLDHSTVRVSLPPLGAPPTDVPGG